MRLTSDKRIYVPDCDDWYKWGADYEQKEYDEIIQYISNFDVALDIGAHVGIWSRRLAEKRKRKERVNRRGTIGVGVFNRPA